MYIFEEIRNGGAEDDLSPETSFAIALNPTPQALHPSSMTQRVWNCFNHSSLGFYLHPLSRVLSADLLERLILRPSTCFPIYHTFS